MSIKIVMDGSGSIGDITPGWSVQEFATPVTIGDSAGGTGNVSFSGKANDDTLFIVNNSITTTEDSLGAISGVIKSVSQTGLSASVTHNTELALFDADLKIPALGAGGVVPAIDICSQLFGRDIILQKDTGYYYSLRGHSQGFNSKGTIAEVKTWDGSVYESLESSTIYYQGQAGAIFGSKFHVLNNDIWAAEVKGDYYQDDPKIISSRIAYKLMLNGGSSVFSAQSKTSPYFNNNNEGAYSLSITIDPIASTISIDGRVITGGAILPISSSQSLAGLDLTKELAVFTKFKRPSTWSGTHTFDVSVYNTDDYTVSRGVSISYSGVRALGSSWSISIGVDNPYTSSGVRGLYKIEDARVEDPGIIELDQEYENISNYAYGTNLVIGGPVPAVNSNAWQYLQDACSAYGQELTLVDNKIVVRNIGESVTSIENIVGSPAIAPSIMFSGRNVEVVYSGASSGAYENFYDARKDDNRVLTVKANEIVTTTVLLNGSPTYLDAPRRTATRPPAGFMIAGDYCVSAADGTLVMLKEWEDYGGSLKVSISTTALNSADVVLTGPVEDIPSKAGPYKLAYTADSTDYAAFSIRGSGILLDTKTVKLPTGANPLTVTQDIAKTITNPFIDTLARAYDRGMLAASATSGPNVTLSGTIPVSAIGGFGITTGSIISYRDSKYRINDVTIGSLAVSFNASRHVTVGDFDLLWAGKTTGIHDLMWSGYDASDQVIAPLRFIGDDESVILSLDTDNNPYYGFSGEPKIAVVTDTDSNPYYVTNPDSPMAEPVYLDTDANPFLEG